MQNQKIYSQFFLEWKNNDTLFRLTLNPLIFYENITPFLTAHKVGALNEKRCKGRIKRRKRS